jgi:hypothetical protein
MRPSNGLSRARCRRRNRRGALSDRPADPMAGYGPFAKAERSSMALMVTASRQSGYIPMTDEAPLRGERLICHRADRSRPML